MGEPVVEPVVEKRLVVMSSLSRPRSTRWRNAAFVLSSLIVVNMIVALVVLRILGIAS